MNKLSPKKVKVGDLMAFTYYTEVTDVLSDGNELVVADLDDKRKAIHVTGKELITKSFSADQYGETIKSTPTGLAERLISSMARPFTVTFVKSNGEERTLRGRLVKTEPLLGRSMVEDLDVKRGARFRQVDHRTIKSLIVDNVRYTA